MTTPLAPAGGREGGIKRPLAAGFMLTPDGVGVAGANARQSGPGLGGSEKQKSTAGPMGACKPQSEKRSRCSFAPCPRSPCKGLRLAECEEAGSRAQRVSRLCGVGVGAISSSAPWASSALARSRRAGSWRRASCCPLRRRCRYRRHQSSCWRCPRPASGRTQQR